MEADGDGRRRNVMHRNERRRKAATGIGSLLSRKQEKNLFN
jgi:hypothetical protein